MQSLLFAPFRNLKSNPRSEPRSKNVDASGADINYIIFLLAFNSIVQYNHIIPLIFATNFRWRLWTEAKVFFLQKNRVFPSTIFDIFHRSLATSFTTSFHESAKFPLRSTVLQLKMEKSGNFCSIQHHFFYFMASIEQEWSFFGRIDTFFLKKNIFPIFHEGLTSEVR